VNERLPSERMALKLLRESGCSRRVINHCKAVEKVATEIAEACKNRGLNVDMELVQIGALLHDIGRSKTHSVHHAIVGAEIARSLNLPEAVISIIERHVGGGITTEEAENLGWPAKSYVPQTLEEKIVTYADKLIEGSERVSIEQTIEKFSRKLPPSSIAGMRKLHEEITLLIGDFDADSDVA
jgi:uncharacterized protein